MEGKPLTDGKAKSLVAYHEVRAGTTETTCNCNCTARLSTQALA
jgi:hypothetical protein